jgi:hypothetical protein
VAVGDFNGDGNFQTPQNFFVAENRPYAIAVGDFNGDGHLDLSVANSPDFSSRGKLNVFLGNGDGSFRIAAPKFPAGSEPRSVAVGDFDQDGHVDLAIVNSDSDTVSVLLGNGDGSFQTARNFPAGKNPDSVAVADFDGDRHLDLVVANEGSGTLSVFLGNGDGSFQPARNFSAGSVPVSVAVGDFDGDGHLDLAVVNDTNAGTVSVLLGKGDGSFQTLRTFPAGYSPSSLVVGDFNGDDHLDLAVTDSYAGNTSTGSVSVLLGNGDGSFQAARNVPVRKPWSLAVGDFDGDGHLDLVVTHGYDVSVLLGNGDGNFQTARNSPAENGFVAIGDFNRDGHLDLAGLSFFNVRVLLGGGDGSFQTLPASYMAGRGPAALAVADFNGDGFPDLAIANYGSGDVSILLNDGSWPGPAPPPGGGRRGPVLERRTPPAPISLAVAELVGYDRGVPASAPPPAPVLPGGKFNRPLLCSDAAMGDTLTVCAAVPGPQRLAAVLARARTEGIALGLIDCLFAKKLYAPPRVDAVIE